MSFEINAEGVDVERLLAEVQRRVAERRGVLYTEEELRYIAERPLEGVVQPHEVRADLLEEFRRRDGSWNYTFDASTLFRSSHGLPGRLIEAARRALRPIQKLFWNPNPMISALSRQSDLHNLVLEVTRPSLEVRELRSRNLELEARLSALARREKTLEGMVVYREEGSPTEREG
jgi:hypothetical protein